MDMGEVDTHMHVWELGRFEYPWPTRDQPDLFTDFTIQQYEEAIEDTPIKHTVFVQVLNSSPAETEWVLKQSETHDVIKGVVAGLDPSDAAFTKQLEHFKGRDRFVSVRHILDFETPDYLSRETTLAGLKELEAAGIPFDALTRPHVGLEHIPAVARQAPNLKMVIEHISKPYIEDGKIDGWKQMMNRAASYPNVHCKVSGLVTEADLKNWKKEDFKPYIQHVVEAFGPNRIFYGSDWPVFKQGGLSYNDNYRLIRDLLADHLSEEELRMAFRENAIKFYNLKL